jgi:hypothetical protein
MTIALDPRQVAAQTQFKANGRSASEQSSAEKSSPTRTASSKVSAAYSHMNLKKFHTQQAADMGLLRPLLMEMMDMEPDTPRSRDIVREVRKIEGGDAERIIDVFAE